MPCTRRVACNSPIRSMPPSRIRRSESPASNSANLMLDEPPLMVRMRGLADFMADAFVMLQSERSQLCACGRVIRVQNAANPQTFRDLGEHQGVFDIEDLLGWHLGDIQRKPKDVRVGLAEMDKAGGNKKIHEAVQLELANPIGIQFASFVTN